MPVFTVELPQNKSAKVLERNEQRKEFTLYNESASNVYVGFNSNVTSASGRYQGIKVLANGGNYANDKHKGEVWVYTTGSGINLTVEEIVKAEQPGGV